MMGKRRANRVIAGEIPKTLSLSRVAAFFSFSLAAALSSAVFCAEPQSFASANFGLAYDKHPKTLVPGEATEVLGPLFGWETSGSATLFRFSPLFSLYRDSSIPQTEFEMAYPILSFDKFGPEYRFQFFQVLSWSGGQQLKDDGQKKRTSIFPFYFRQTSPDPAENYTAVVPFYGRLKNRFFRDEVFFVMMPLYVQSVKRGVTTYNYLYPFFHRRTGPGLKGWQFWPLVGHEQKEVTTSTNNWGDLVVSGGHEKFFALWPFFFKNTLGIGTTNEQKQLVVLPFYTSQEASNRTSKSYGFPLGFTHTVDRAAGYEERGAPWPLVVFSRGTKTVNRVWPLFGKASNQTLQSDFYAWPLYKYNRLSTELLERERTRIMLFLYSDIAERNKTNHTVFRRRDFWPLFTWRKDRDGRERLQALSLLEPILPNNKSIERVYSPVYALWRQEKNPLTGASSKSLLWNLYREDKRPDAEKQSALFGLFQREKSGGRTRWRLFYIPFGKSGKEPGQVAGE
jgi:hypothetical protein